MFARGSIGALSADQDHAATAVGTRVFEHEIAHAGDAAITAPAPPRLPRRRHKAAAAAVARTWRRSPARNTLWRRQREGAGK